jgi:hypothetical protein
MIGEPLQALKAMTLENRPDVEIEPVAQDHCFKAPGGAVVDKFRKRWIDGLFRYKGLKQLLIECPDRRRFAEKTLPG